MLILSKQRFSYWWVVFGDYFIEKFLCLETKLSQIQQKLQRLMMLQQTQFTNITHLFYSGQYSEGLKQISKIITRETNNSNLFVNRALFLQQLGNDEQAIKDLEKALEVNPRNYIAYFNLFSIYTKLVEDEEALANLCCSLSCLYLIRGKSTKNIDDVEKSIHYSYNNHEAHVLKGLLLMQDQKYSQSVLAFQSGLSVDQKNQTIKNLKKVAAQKGHIHEQSNIHEFIQHQTNYRLKCSYKRVDGSDLIDQIDHRLTQFNRLYVDINNNAGAVTQKVPKESMISPENSNQRSNRQQDIKIIYDSGLSTPKKQSDIHPEPGNVFIKSSIVHEEAKNEFFQFGNNANFEEEKFISIINQEEVGKNEEECILPINQKETDEMQDEFTSVLKTDPLLQEEKERFESIISELKDANFEAEQNQDQAQQSQPIEHYNLIYPLDDHMKLKVNILNLQFIDKDQEFLSKLSDVYCILNYNNGKNKLKTICKACDDGVCTWNQEFQPIDISQKPTDMKIKIYNKKYKSVRDDFLGDLEVLITTADLLKLPLYNKSGILGTLLLHLQLVQITPPPQNEQPINEEEIQSL